MACLASMGSSWPGRGGSGNLRSLRHGSEILAVLLSLPRHGRLAPSGLECVPPGSEPITSATLYVYRAVSAQVSRRLSGTAQGLAVGVWWAVPCATGCPLMAGVSRSRLLAH